MTVTSQQYASLANHSYEDLEPGRHTPGEAPVMNIDGVDYRVLEHVNNEKTGYQGTVYQSLQSGDIVVAHRGTEQIWKDAVIADGSMVVSRTNPQADDAVELTRRALDTARRIGAQPGMAAPEVTVTGHSLGGTLAQVSAHHFDLRGETFNAYGAASLDRGIPGGPNERMVNHVLATDVVSAASPQYGKVVTYATEHEMDVLHQSGYFNNRFGDMLVPDLPVVAAARSFGAHSMHNFMPRDGDGNPDVSVLDDPQALARADEHSRMIADYRGDVMDLRRGATFVAGGPAGWVRDGIDLFRDPVPAGEPAAREAREAAERAQQEGAAVNRASADMPITVNYQGNDARQDSQVSQLLEAARAGNPEGIRLATQELQASPFGQGWQQQVDQQVQLLNQRDAPQQAPAPIELGRGG